MHACQLKHSLREKIKRYSNVDVVLYQVQSSHEKFKTGLSLVGTITSLEKLDGQSTVGFEGVSMCWMNEIPKDAFRGPGR